MEETKDNSLGGYSIENERVDEVSLFDCLPLDVTSGTAYEYFTNFPWFDEEVYYLLEVATRENADKEEVVNQCAQLVDERNRQLLDSFGGKEIFECELSLESDLNYNECPDIFKLSVRNEDTERDSKH